MGYTHYWNTAEFTKAQWNEIATKTKKILRTSSVPVQFEYDNDRPARVDDHMIRFNGVEVDGHETFLIAREGTVFNFCKTARKPYDEVVVAILVMISDVNPSFEWSSDGDKEDHAQGVALYNRAVGL